MCTVTWDKMLSKHACAHTYMHIYVHSYMPLCKHSYMHAYTHKLVYIHTYMHTFTLNSACNKKKYAEILLRYMWLFVKGDVFIGKRGIFGAEVFLCYRQFFIKNDFVIGGVECMHLCMYAYMLTYLHSYNIYVWMQSYINVCMHICRLIDVHFHIYIHI